MNTGNDLELRADSTVDQAAGLALGTHPLDGSSSSRGSRDEDPSDRASSDRASSDRASSDRASSDGASSDRDNDGGGDEAGDSPVNYEEAALLEIELDGTDYRLDVGRAGTALCISTRPNGSWSWVFRGEARWQSNVLRCKAFDRSVLTKLARALAEAAADSQS